jgi:hypothetical protein
MEDMPQAEMPRYKCHKIVHALKIKALEKFGSVTFMQPEEKQFANFALDKEFVDKHNPKVGGYYVVYKDGYKSFSPAEAFESGYTRI